MNNKNKIIELTFLVEETLRKLDKLKQEKEILKQEYKNDPSNINTLDKIKILEKKYAILYKKSLELNEEIRKLKNDL